MQQSAGEISLDEKKILTATLELNRKTVKEVMTPIQEVFMLDINTVIDRQAMKEIYTKGYSRIPVFKGSK